jgi:hypothetical protein
MVTSATAQANKQAAPARKRRRTTGTLAYLRRIRTYLWIGLVNPGPPVHPRR